LVGCSQIAGFFHYFIVVPTVTFLPVDWIRLSLLPSLLIDPPSSPVLPIRPFQLFIVVRAIPEVSDCSSYRFFFLPLKSTSFANVTYLSFHGAPTRGALGKSFSQFFFSGQDHQGGLLVPYLPCPIGVYFFFAFFFLLPTSRTRLFFSVSDLFLSVSSHFQLFLLACCCSPHARNGATARLLVN